MTNLPSKKEPTSLPTKGLSTQKGIEVRKVERVFKVEYNRIVEGVKELEELFLDNKQIYNSEFNFEPLVGETYHLYERKNGSYFLSLIGPKEGLKNKFIGSYFLDEKRVWNKIDKG